MRKRWKSILVIILGIISGIIGVEIRDNLRERNYNEEAKIENYKNIEIMYFEEQEGCIEVIKNYIDTAIKRSEKFFDTDDIGKVKIILHKNEKSFEMDRKTTGAYYNTYKKTMNFYVENPLTQVIIDSGFEKMLIHEYSHHALKEVSKKRKTYKKIPSWFDEGLAEVMAKEGYSIWPIEKFVEISNLDTSLEFSNEVDGKYNQSYAIMDNLIARFGDNIVMEIVKGLESYSFSEAFKIATNVELDQFENEIRNLKIKTKIEDEKPNKNKLNTILNYIEKYPNQESGYEIAGTMFLTSGEFEKAIKIIKKGIEVKEKYTLWNLLGMAYEDSGNLELSKKAFMKGKELKEREENT